MITAQFLCNRLPTRAQDPHNSPYEEWTKTKPLLANLKVFGCHAYVHVPKEKQSKVDPISSLCRFLGYSDQEKAYRFEEISTCRIIVSREAQFMEDTFNNGKREPVTTKPVELRDERDDPSSEGDCGSYDHANHEDMEEQPVDQPSAPTRSTERPQWHQVNTINNRTHPSSRMSPTPQGPSARRGLTLSRIFPSL